jgi:hypothetical protein
MDSGLQPECLHLVRLVVELQGEVFGTSIYERPTSGEFSRRPYTKYIITFIIPKKFNLTRLFLSWDRLERWYF